MPSYYQVGMRSCWYAIILSCWHAIILSTHLASLPGQMSIPCCFRSRHCAVSCCPSPYPSGRIIGETREKTIPRSSTFNHTVMLACDHNITLTCSLTILLSCEQCIIRSCHHDGTSLACLDQSLYGLIIFFSSSRDAK